MGFAETRPAIKKEWIIAVARRVYNTTGGGNSEVIIWPNYEIIQGVLRIKASAVWGFFGEFGFDFLNTGFKWDIFWSDFAGANFWLGTRLDFKIYIVYGDVVVF